MATLTDVVSLLRSEYGTPPRVSDPAEPIDELIQTILSQHTSDSNTERAFKSLKRAFPTWDDVVIADTRRVADAIRSGGLADQKAPRIQQVLKEIKAQHRTFDLHFLKDLERSEAISWLTQFKGVGPKTAACVLLFSLGMPVMPVDTHVHRVALRLGLLKEGTSAEQAHGALEEGLNANEVYDAHMLLITHGRRICRARNPFCGRCVLNEICPSAAIYTS